MSAKQKPPAGEPWIWLTRELLSSAAWHCLSINSWRFINFLLLEHMRHGGTKNGWLMAPRRQLVAFGIGPRFISGAINEAERAGLVDCRRGAGRRPSVYALTWLPLPDGTPASNRWRQSGRAEGVNNEFPRELTRGIPRELTKPVASVKGNSQNPSQVVPKGTHLIEDSFPGGAANSFLEGGERR